MSAPSAARRLLRSARWTGRDLLTRSGALPYRGLGWSLDAWSDSYAARRTDGYANVEDLARYSVLSGYLRFLPRPGRVLDVGCGAGLMRDRLGTLDFDEYVGIDPVAEAVAQATAKQHPRTVYVTGDVTTADIGSFDAVICNEVLYVAPDPAALLDRIAALLRPGGHLLCAIWRHPGDALLWKQVDARFEVVDRVELRNRANPLAPRGTVVSLHRSRA